MQYVGRTPSPPLDAFIERIWYCSDAPTHTRERVLPGGGALGLVFNLAEGELQIYDPANPGLVRARGGALVSGTCTRSYLYDPRQRASIVGVHFRPGGAFPFLGISPSEIVDSHVPLDDLWGSGGRNVHEQLLEASSPSERFRLLEAALLRRLRSARPVHAAVRAAVAALRDGGNGVRVAEVAAAVGLSRRRFIEVFEREVGLTPKLYARLQRFHRVKQLMATLGGPASWASFAIACGYFDQSHMLRDFLEFSSMSPASYLEGRTEETLFDHVVHAYPRAPGTHKPA
jgi:methylphosphotriester-DNA--protein-cysteine methyltransferase